MPTVRLPSRGAAHGMTGRTLRSSDRDEIDTEIHESGRSTSPAPPRNACQLAR